jgi:hypothetical protein
MRNTIHFDFTDDNYFSELKTTEILTERLRLANEIDPLVGKYYSMKWVRSNILQMTEQEIKDVDKEIEAEQKVMGDDQMGGPIDYGNQDDDQQQTQDQQEQFVPQPTISEEEKRLVESMTRFMDSMASENIEDDDE